MITIIAKSIVKKEMKEQFKEKAAELVDLSNKEEGCISYNLYENMENNNIMAFIEEWKDKEAIRLHNNTEHFKTIVPELAKFREGKPEINLYKTVFNK